MKTDILIVGGGTGGVAAALAAASCGMRVILTEETDWIGGQLTTQAVPPDEHPWIESRGCTRRYRNFRNGVRQYYRDHFPLTDAARNDPHLNPGGGYVSHLCFEPRVGLAVLQSMLQPLAASRTLTILLHQKPFAADTNGDFVRSVTLQNTQTNETQTIEADYILDATELGDLLPQADVEYLTGAESRTDTHELHAIDGPAQPDNIQAFTWCLPLAFDPTPSADHTIDRPAQYERWRNHIPQLSPPWPGRLLDWTIPVPWTLQAKRYTLFPTPKNNPSLFQYRQIISHDRFTDPSIHDATILNWPQNDYWLTNIIDQPPHVISHALTDAKQLSLSLVYWLQTECGFHGLYLRPDLTGTADGFAKSPYFRESRRIRALFTITENHIGTESRYGVNPTGPPPPHMHAENFSDTVGVGYYRIDLHPSTGGNNFIDVSALPFQIPLGALLPQRIRNFLPACKNIGTTRITNGCYRVHPVEWNIGESAGLLAAFCLQHHVEPHQVREDPSLLTTFQNLLINQGVELSWD